MGAYLQVWPFMGALAAFGLGVEAPGEGESVRGCGCCWLAAKCWMSSREWCSETSVALPLGSAGVFSSRSTGASDGWWAGSRAGGCWCWSWALLRARKFCASSSSSWEACRKTEAACDLDCRESSPGCSLGGCMWAEGPDILGEGAAGEWFCYNGIEGRGGGGGQW